MAELMQQHAGEMKRVEIGWIVGKDELIEMRRLFGAALLMQGQGLLNDLCRSLLALDLGGKAHDSAWRNAGAIAGAAI
jgi:hypothetical protein